jgi:hypothetical protein
MQPPKARAASLLGALAVLTVVLLPLGGPTAGALALPVPLGAARTFAVLGASTVTNTGPTLVDGDLGVSPGTSITGFPPGVVTGTVHAGDAAAQAARTAAQAAFDAAASQAVDVNLTGQDLGGLVLTPGVYAFDSSALLTGALTLASGDPNGRWVFRIGSTLTTASGSAVILTGAAQACNVVWQVGSSATVGTGTQFAGDVLALASITLTTGASLEGRALALNGAVTLDTNLVGPSDCALAAPALTSTATAAATVGGPISDTATLTGAVAPTGTMTFSLFGPTDPTCTGTPIFTTAVPVTGNGEHASGPFTTTAAGDHRWIASYGGDEANDPVTGACGDAGETSAVAAVPTGTGTSTTSSTVADLGSTTTTTPAPVAPTPTPPTAPGRTGTIPRTGTGPSGQLLVGTGAILAGAGFLLLVDRRRAGLS